MDFVVLSLKSEAVSQSMGLWRTFGHFSLAGRSLKAVGLRCTCTLVITTNAWSCPLFFLHFLTFLFFISLHKRMALETVGWCLQQQISPRSATSSAQPIIWQVLLVSVLHGVHSLERCKARQAERGVSVSWERRRAVIALRVSVTVLWVRERRQRLANCWPANAFCGIFWHPTTVSVLLEVRKGRFFFSPPQTQLMQKSE